MSSASSQGEVVKILVSTLTQFRHGSVRITGFGASFSGSCVCESIMLTSSFGKSSKGERSSPKWYLVTGSISISAGY